ncbi:hypothetical protein [Pseudomaricurvus sp.]|uniref:hypothetical protein n=1 Tax=Pseudomaricurvus sp. TaxID=2004510 RepID=UPI003F6BCEA2
MPTLIPHSAKHYLYATLLLCSLPFSHAQAGLIGYADVVLDYFDSGTGRLSGPFGGHVNDSIDSTSGVYPIATSTSVVLGSDPEGSGEKIDFLSLPTGSYVTLGFTDETITDGAGADFFINDAGAHLESADVFVSSNLIDFVFLGTVFSNISMAMDLASISFTDPVQAIKVVGRDTEGGSAGFDLANIEVLSGSIGTAPQSSPVAVPSPASLALMVLGLAVLSRGQYRQKKAAALSPSCSPSQS